LIRRDVSDHIAAVCAYPGEVDAGSPIKDMRHCVIREHVPTPSEHALARRDGMEGKAKFIFPVVITAIIVFIVSGVVTFFNIGLRTDFVPRWLSAFIVGWPVASVTAFVAIPFARNVTLRVVGLIDGKG